MDPVQMLGKLVAGEDLEMDEAGALLDAAAEGLEPALLGGLLVALRVKGETVDEIAGLVSAMRRHMTAVKPPAGAIDVCGTGGDGAQTFNVSTTVALVVAAAGVPVAKHGNRAASSLCGSADVLEALGVRITLAPEEAQEVLEKVGMVFLFAPLYHPALKQVAIVRKALGVRTIFNLLGPFANPAGVRRQLVGVPSEAMAARLAEVGSRLGYERLMVVAGNDGLDELSTGAVSVVYDVEGASVRKYTINPGDYGFAKAKISDLAGGDAQASAELIRAILAGRQGPPRDIVLLNAAAALVVAGVASDFAAGMARAGEVIDSGAAATLLERLAVETQKYA